MYQIAVTAGQLRRDLIKQGFGREKAEDITETYIRIYLQDMADNGENITLAAHAVTYGEGESMTFQEARNYLGWA